MDKTFVMIKPDAVKRNLIGKIISRIEDAKLKILEMKMLELSAELAGTHYDEHKGKDFYNNLIEFVTSGPSVAMVLQAENVIPLVRKMIGATDPKEADSGTIRGDLKEIPVKSVTENMIHASDSEETAKREIGLFFPHIKI
ncbi:MAG: nucleoside-diphosphate kinase [Candidatus Lokiarchaeota archaeon]|nr:nucleoside-diphosphate kinase [Candidatus Lokiarchaeota archaeon]MBD3343375.1 nucleoside-diphosphate kinase [Candidatus Lokiarchaeota archaeon]